MNWRQLAKPYQLPPQGEWSEWVMSGGRGAGKTRTGVEWLIEEALSLPGETLAIIAPTLDETRIIDFHGIAGLLSNVPYVAVERYRKSALTLELTNGARIVGLSADRPEEWRGRVFARVLCEERQAWPVRADEDDSQAVFEAQQRLDEQVLNLLRVPGAKRMVTMT
ncbi:terminase large subunit, partial [Caulobacter phage RLK]